MEKVIGHVPNVWQFELIYVMIYIEAGDKIGKVEFTFARAI